MVPVNVEGEFLSLALIASNSCSFFDIGFLFCWCHCILTREAQVWLQGCHTRIWQTWTRCVAVNVAACTSWRFFSLIWTNTVQFGPKQAPNRSNSGWNKCLKKKVKNCVKTHHFDSSLKKKNPKIYLKLSRSLRLTSLSHTHGSPTQTPSISPLPHWPKLTLYLSVSKWNFWCWRWWFYLIVLNTYLLFSFSFKLSILYSNFWTSWSGYAFNIHFIIYYCS